MADFDFEDMLKQMQQMRKMGGLGSFMSMLPGIGKLKKQLDEANIDDKAIKRQEAIIQSMTKAERRDVNLIGASRKRRIALGAGVEVSDVNRLIKQFMQSRKMFKQLRKMGKSGIMRNVMPALRRSGM